MNYAWILEIRPGYEEEYKKRHDEIWPEMVQMLKEAGYNTAFIGKWHLDHPDSVETWAYGHGFDYAVQEQWKARFNGKREFPPNRLWINGDEEYILYNYLEYDCKDALRTDMAFEFLDQNIDKPFFLFMSYRAPHSFEGPIRDTLLYGEKGWPEIERVHAAKITLFDKQVGRLIKKLADEGSYDNVVFHRVIDGFMAQTGDVKFGNSSSKDFDLRRAGIGGSDLPDLNQEFNDLPHDRGTVSMARSSDPNSANSQFFICFKPAPFLDRQYTVFGKVIEGMEFVDMITKGDGDNGAVSNPDKIISFKSQ